MLDPSILLFVHLRLCSLFSRQGDETPFAGRHVLLLGDFLQLPAVGASLLTAALDNGATGDRGAARDLFRRFSLTMLDEQMRAADDPFHLELLRRMGSPLRHEQPLTAEMLAPTCPHCLDEDGSRLPDPLDHARGRSSCPPRCPHRCLHLKELNEADLRQDPLFATAKFVAPCNSTVDRWSLVALREHARRTGQVVLRWRLLSTSSAENAQELVPDEMAEQYVDLWGYYARDVPVTLTRNANTAVQFAHGVSAVLHAFVPEDAALLQRLLQRPGLAAGDIVTLPAPPRAVLVRIPRLGAAARDALTQAGLPLSDVGEPLIPLLSRLAPPQVREVKLGRDETGPIKLNVHDPGYDLGFASTIHGVQGDTVQRLIVDFNRPTSGERTLNIHSVYTAWSRVRSAAHIRVSPWNPLSGRFSHLLQLRHDSLYVNFLRAFNDEGVFAADRVVEAPERPGQRRRRELLARPPPAPPQPPSTLEAFPRQPSAVDGATIVTPAVPAPVPVDSLPPASTLPTRAPHGLVRLARSCARQPTQSWAYMPLLRSIFQAPALDGDRKALQLLTAYWDPACPLSPADALLLSSELVAQLLPPQLRVQIAAQLGQHIDGDVQNLLLGDLTALTQGRDLYESWVRTAFDAIAADNTAPIAVNLLQVVGTFNAAIWRLRQANGVME
jgi:hypothetical protein